MDEYDAETVSVLFSFWPHSACLPLAACANPSDDLAVVNRLSWGETAQGDTLGGLGAQTWLEQQLHPSDDDGLPPQVKAEIDAMEISQKPPSQLITEVRDLQRQARPKRAPPDDDTAHKAYQRKLAELMREAQTRSLLRDLYSKNQLKEQLTWFWMNHFNVSQNKDDIRALVGDYEDHAIRAHALGKFRDLLAATADPSRDAAISGQCPERGRPYQRELRPRDHGAAHPGRGLAATPSTTCRNWRAS